MIRHYITEKSKTIIYWITTSLLAAGMFFGAIAQVARAPWNVEGMVHLGFPLYFMTLIGIWKLLGVVILLLPKLPLCKEWAYAGFFFLMTGAVVSHLASGDGWKGILFQSLFILLIMASWYLRPSDRKLLILPLH